jgi:hypothetical protein
VYVERERERDLIHCPKITRLHGPENETVIENLLITIYARK